MEYKLIYIRNIPIYARLANTPSSREQGLMGVTSLQSNEGCLFVFGSSQYTNFWMKNCKINLQAATISESGEIIDIHDMEFANPNYIYKSSRPVSYVLEMPEKFFTEHGIRVGDSVKIEY